MSYDTYDTGGYDEELELIKRRKLEELYRKAEEERIRREKEQQEELIRQELLRQILTPEARERLANLKLVKPDLVKALEAQLIMLAQSGRVGVPITDDVLKEILYQLYEKNRRETKIRIREKGW